MQGEQEALRHQLETLKRRRADQRGNSASQRRVGRKRPGPRPGSDIETDEASGTSDSENDGEQPARKKSRSSVTAAKQLDAEMKRLAKKLTMMGALWPPATTPETHFKGGVLETALGLSEPFPETEPDPLHRYEDFEHQYSSFRWEIRCIFGLEVLEKYAEETWFCSLVSSASFPRCMF
jgi:hypothetical protein